MRRVSMLVTAAVLVFVVAVGVRIGTFELQKSALDAQAKDFVNHAMSGIAEDWSSQKLLDHSTPELRARLRHGDFAVMSEGFTRLGRLWRYAGATGGVNMPYLPIFSGPLSASYIAKAGYDHGVATFEIELVRHDGQWLINKFHIDVQYLSPVPAQFG